MSFLDEDRSITEGAHRFDLFTNRQEICFRYLEYLHSEPHPETVLHLIGDPGNGKTLLLNVFGKKLSRQIDVENWEYLRSLERDDCIDQIWGSKEVYGNVPVATIDFGETTPNALSALTLLRRQLSGIAFPRFELAVIAQLSQSGELSPHSVNTHFLIEDVPQLLEIAAAFGAGIPGQGYVLGRIIGPITQKLNNMRLRANIGADTVQEILELAESDDLEYYLPNLFARDMEAALGQNNGPKAVVLLIDTHEALTQRDPDLPARTVESSDRWLRRLVLKSPLAKGAVIVVGSRARLRWPDMPTDPVPETRIETRHVVDFTDDHAREYMVKAGIESDQTIRLLMEDARVGEDRIHPLMLGLGADLARMIDKNERRVITEDDLRVSDGGADRHVQIMNRFLSYIGPELEQAIIAMSACRQFSRPIFDFLGKRLAFECTAVGFELITSFSFVLPAAGESIGESWRTHQLLKRVIAETERDQVLLCHEAMIEFYTQHAGDDDTARVEAVYHALEYDQEIGLQRWHAAFGFGLERARYSTVCEPLFDLLPARHNLSDADYGRVIFSSGNYRMVRSQYEQAIDDYAAALRALDAALTSAPNNPVILNNKGLVLQKRGEIEYLQRRFSEASQTYTESISTYDQALESEPAHPEALLCNKGGALASQGDIARVQKQHAEAKQCYNDAIEIYGWALMLSPDGLGAAYASHNKGLSLVRRGMVENSLGQLTEAMHSFNDAIAMFDQASRLRPDHLDSVFNKGLALMHRGEAEQLLERFQNARKSFSEAICVHDRALEKAPHDPRILSNKADVLVSRARLEQIMSGPEKAVRSFGEAVAIYGEALEFAPNDPRVLNNDGLALKAQGELYLELGDFVEASASLESAVEMFDRALVSADAFLGIGSSKALALRRYGEAKQFQLQFVEAGISYDLAISIYNQLLILKPDDPEHLINQGVAFQRRGEVRLAQGLSREALSDHNEAIIAYDSVWELDPKYPGIGIARIQSRLFRILLMCLNNAKSVTELLDECAVVLGIHNEVERSELFFGATAEKWLHRVRLAERSPTPCAMITDYF